ncbi:MAG TPA: hypothetical protein VGO39_04465 [Gaiellaceae bacterium]|nr:hypothetical protein [Gaiellaceae bacterium]
MRRVAVLTALLVAAGALAALAVAGPYIGPASKTRARVGDVIHLKAGAGIRMYALLPLYLVSTKDALLPTPCTIKGTDGICEPRVAGPPRGATYHRIGTLNVRHANDVTITFRVPKLTPGEYLYVLYCGPCYRGPGGSLIAQTQPPTLTVVR